jgi:hypothetical protein
MWIVYEAISPKGKKYIGITCRGLKHRIGQHWAQARGKGYRHQGYFQKAFLKYGDQIVWNILHSDITEQEAKRLEQHYILVFQTHDPDKGYNCTFGGEGGKHTQAARQKMSEIAKKKGLTLTLIDLALRKCKPIKRSDGQTYKSVKEAAKENNVTTVSIRRAFSCGSKCKGFQFAFFDQAFLMLPERKVQEHATRFRSPLVRSDGKIFVSGVAAAAEVGLSNAAISYAMKKDRPTKDGFKYWRINPDMSIPLAIQEKLQESCETKLWKNPPGISSTTRQKMSESASNRSTEEWRQKASERCKNKRPIQLSDGRKFHSVREAAKTLGVARNALDGALARGGTCRGLRVGYI